MSEVILIVPTTNQAVFRTPDSVPPSENDTDKRQKVDDYSSLGQGDGIKV